MERAVGLIAFIAARQCELRPAGGGDLAGHVAKRHASLVKGHCPGHVVQFQPALLGREGQRPVDQLALHGLAWVAEPPPPAR